MATWPESNPTPAYPLIVTPRFNTNIIEFGGSTGGEERRRNTLYPKYDVQVRYDGITGAEVAELWNFFIARKGAWESFYIYDLSLLAGYSQTHEGLYVGTADGQTTIFDLPGRESSNQAVYVAGSLETSALILFGGGNSGSDRINFPAAPTAGSIITCDFTGYLRMKVRFALDTFDKELFTYTLYQNNNAIDLIGV